MSTGDWSDQAHGKARGTQLHSTEVKRMVRLPVVGHIAAGVPSLGDQSIEEEIPVPAFLVGNKRSFLLRVQGDSMEGAGILDGDLVVVQQTHHPKVNDIVAVSLEGETTLKRLKRDGDFWLLASENPRYTQIRPDSELAFLQRSYYVYRASCFEEQRLIVRTNLNTHDKALGH